jgi:ABC-type glycerol-3-phosphate transport system substrate-binding protein
MGSESPWSFGLGQGGGFLSLAQENGKRLGKAALCGLLLLMFLALSACGRGSASTPPTEGSQNDKSESQPSATSVPTKTPTPRPTVSVLGVDKNALSGVTLQFWHAASGALEQEIEAVVGDFNRQNSWGITVYTTPRGGFDQIFEDMQVATKEQSRPNVVTAFLYQALYWRAEKDLLVDLGPYINDAVWGLEADEQADYYPVFWGHGQERSKMWGIPFWGSAQMIYYNRTWAKELGFSSAPTSPTQFRQQACAAALANKKDEDSTNDGTGGWMISLNYSAVLGWIHAFGGEVMATEGEGYRFDTPEVEEAFTFLRELYDEGCAWLSDSPSPEAEFAARRALFVHGSSAGIPYQEDAFVETASADEWTVIPFPSPVGKPVVEVYGPLLFILRASPEEQLASWLFVRWLTSAEVQGRLARVSGYLPVRRSALDFVQPLPEVHPQWEAAVGLLSYAREEPRDKSWRIVRWAVSDAATQLFRYYFHADQVPALTRLLNETANDLVHGLK